MIDRTERLADLLRDAILVAESSSESAVLGYLRGARHSLRESMETDVTVRVDLISGRVFARGLPVPLSRCELAVVMLLALNERGATREMLAEDLYPGVDPVAGLNTLKVNIHRVRRRIASDDVIRYGAGKYSLGDAVDIDLPRIEAEVRRSPPSGRLTTESRDRFERLRQRVLDGRPGYVLEWPWFDETEQRLRDLGHELTIILARDALCEDRYQRALELVAELGRDDPLDEVAVEIAIRALLLAGNRAAAVLHYRRYASILRREIDSRPSEGLRALVDEV